MIRIIRQPRLGTIRVDAQGRRWKKVRTLPHQQYVDEMVWQVGGARIAKITGKAPEDLDPTKLGYELIKEPGS